MFVGKACTVRSIIQGSKLALRLKIEREALPFYCTAIGLLLPSYSISTFLPTHRNLGKAFTVVEMV
jgi:hypothetical protein